MAKKKTILVVEDDENTRQLLGLYLDWGGYRATFAKDGRTAVRMAKGKKPDLAVVDIMIPEIHGIGVCEILKKDPKTARMPVMIISVKNFPADQKQAEAAGADMFLAKPVSEKAFLSAVGRLLKGKSKGKTPAA